MDGRRTEVQSLLLKGSSQKLVAAAPDEARTLLERAHALAWEDPPLPGPVRHLVAYRLAHVLMRCRSGRTELARAEALLAAACEPDLLGPLPWIYRLAALHRLGAEDAAIDEVYRGARASIARGLGAAPPALQAPDLNLLELACYFLDRPYDLEGPGGVLDGLAPAGFEPWIVVGGSGTGMPLRLPEAWAMAEISEHAARPQAVPLIVFRLGAELAQWRTPERPWTPAHLAQLRLLATLLAEPASRDELERRALAESTDRGGTLRQYKHRLEHEVRTLLGRPELTVFAPSPPGAPFELASEVRAVGAVQARLLEPC